MVSAGLEALRFDAGLGGRIALEQGERDSAKSGHVLFRIAGADAAFVFTKRHVEGPMKTVLDGPVRSNGPSNGFAPNDNKKPAPYCLTKGRYPSPACCLTKDRTTATAVLHLYPTPRN